jgi:hypothetical protein
MSFDYETGYYYPIMYLEVCLLHTFINYMGFDVVMCVEFVDPWPYIYICMHEFILLMLFVVCVVVKYVHNPPIHLTLKHHIINIFIWGIGVLVDGKEHDSCESKC